MSRRLTRADIFDRLQQEFLGGRLIDNSLRGYWCEAMLAIALGPDCRIVSGGWHPWDLEIGDAQSDFPKRIRIQVKNAAYRQTWYTDEAGPSDPVFSLNYRRKPYHFGIQPDAAPCEPEGFLCEAFALCLHATPSEDADHREPSQWLVYIVPTVGPNPGVTEGELSQLQRKLATNGKPASTQRKPATLERGIRGRPSIAPIKVTEVRINHLLAAVGLQELPA